MPTQEFRTGCRELGFDAPRAAFDALFDEVDTDRSGVVEFKELHAALRQGSSVVLEKALRVGAAGRIETRSTNPIALRGAATARRPPSWN